VVIDMRKLACAAVAALVACSSPTQQQRVDSAEIAQLSQVKHGYPDVVMGFDIRPETTLIVSLDLQHYIEMDDDDVAAMQRAAVARWREAWMSAHPGEHATLRVRFIDFIGRKVAEKTTDV
jgi:hypothetical protein